MNYGVTSWIHSGNSYSMGVLTLRDTEKNRVGFIKLLSKGMGEGTGGCYAAIRGMLTLSQQWGSYLSMQEPNESQEGQGYLRFLGKRQSGQTTPKTNKSRALMMGLVTGLDGFAFPPVYCNELSLFSLLSLSFQPSDFGHYLVILL